MAYQEQHHKKSNDDDDQVYCRLFSARHFINFRHKHLFFTKGELLLPVFPPPFEICLLSKCKPSMAPDARSSASPTIDTRNMIPINKKTVIAKMNGFSGRGSRKRLWRHRCWWSCARCLDGLSGRDVRESVSILAGCDLIVDIVEG